MIILEPFTVIVLSKSTGSVTVLLTASPQSPGVTHYEVSGEGRSCELQASATPLSCDLRNLHSGMQLTVLAVACLANSECSSAKSASGYTLPDGNIILTIATCRCVM